MKDLPLQQYADLLIKYLEPQWKRVVFLAVLIFAGIGLKLLSPQIIRRFIDTAQAVADPAMAEEFQIQVPANGMNALLWMGVLYLIVIIIDQAARLLAAYVTEDVKWRATNWLRNDLSRHCIGLDMSFHNDYTPGTMIERVDGDVQHLSNFFSQFILRIVGNLLLMIGVLVMLFREQWQIGLFYSLFSIGTILLLARTVGFSIPFWKEERETASQMFGGIEEWLGGLEDLRANGGSGYVMDRLQRAIYRNFRALQKAMFAGSLTWGLSGLIFAFGLALSLGLGAYYFYQGAITIGTVYLVMSYSSALNRPIAQLARQLQDLQSATAAISRLRELFDIEPTITDAPTPIQLLSNDVTTNVNYEKGEPSRAFSVTFDHVTFGYSVDDPVLKDVDFTLDAGRVLGLLGRTGSGKTTITRLLFRLYDPTYGAVELSGNDLRQATLNEIRSSVGMVTQDVQLFQATVRDNLTFFDRSISDDRIVGALEVLGLSSWFNSLHQGLDTHLRTGGRGLSAGQAQLLAFTRVFLKDPKLVILDEASSRLDPVTEQLIEQAIDRLFAGRTAIIVAHRLATVQRADEIMILSDGQIVEHGERQVLVNDPASRFSQLLQTGLEEVLV